MKMILAILHKDDELDTTAELNKENFFVTKLTTTGGFLKSKNTTILIGTEDGDVQKAADIIQKYAGRRQSLRYTAPNLESGGAGSVANMSVPIQTEVGGCTMFVLDVDRFVKF